MVVIGLDISTTSTGVAIFEDEVLKESYVIKPKGKLMADRFNPMLQGLMDCLHKFSPEVIGIEDTFVGKDGDTVKFLTRLQGAVIGWCFENKKTYYTFVPNVWRSHLNFKFIESGIRLKRDEMKKQSQDYVKEHFGISCDDDESDAICIGLFASKLVIGKESLEPKRIKKKTVKKVKKLKKE